ncbi:hypothetical protein [Methylobacterium sp. GC_Met_3]|uniref:hypothetical protein n=1 Tax=Methylobacterium sp. GC_Met_3 TaxID=2937375 RepID=UPI00226A8C7B|nr:hypothetical protein [Methylobacterium sp. GC_Met_3]
MADETLRMEAEVRDKFSGPLKSLRQQLLDTGREGAQHGQNLAKGMGKAEAAIQSTAKAAQTVLNPALATLGVTGLGAGVAVAGIASALNNLGGNLSSLGQLSRETGMAADQLRIFQSVAGKFGISTDASAAAAKTFASNMRDIRRGSAEISGFLQSQNPIISQYFEKFKNSKNNDEATKIFEDMLEHVKDPVDRARLAGRMTGNEEFGRLGDGSRGPIASLNRSTAERLGPLPPGSVESAERYERAIADLRGSMQRVGTTIATELLGPAEKFTTWIDEVVAGKRGDVTKGLREGIRGIKTELEAINWQEFGKDSLAILGETTALAGKAAGAFHQIAETIHSLRNGEYLQALRGADGADGSLARKVAPRVGDDELDARENVDRLRKLRDLSSEAASHLIGRTQQRMGLIDSPEAAQQKLDAAEAELKRLQARTPEQRQKDFEASDKLRRSIDNLSETIKAQQGATAQKSSADGDGPFAGAKIQSASYGGGGGFGRMPGLGGGSGPGYSGEQGERSAMRERFREHLKRTVPGYDGGDTVPIGPGGRVPPMGGSVPRGDGSGNARAARTGQMMGYAMDQLRREGVPEDQLRQAAAHLVGQATMESGLDPNKVHDGGTGYGIYGARDPHPGRGRRTEMFNWLERNGYARNSAEGQMREMAHRAMSGRFPQTRGILLGRGSGDLDRDTNAITGEFESPAIINRRSGAVRNALRTGPEVAANRPEGIPRPDISSADGEGWASREKARKEFEAKIQQGEGRLDRSAGRAGVMGGNKLEANGSVSVVVQKPGPETQVRTSTAGNLFKDVVLRRGRPMAAGDST